MNEKLSIISFLAFSEENLEKANTELVKLITRGELLVNGEMTEVVERIASLENQLNILKTRTESVRKIDKARESFVKEVNLEAKKIVVEEKEI